VQHSYRFRLSIIAKKLTASDRKGVRTIQDCRNPSRRADTEEFEEPFIGVSISRPLHDVTVRLAVTVLVSEQDFATK
jgi:hypothetical protein